MNTRIAMEYSALRHCGRQMFQKMCHSPAPSSFADSISETGMRRMDFVSRNTENGANAPGRMIAHRVLSSPRKSDTR